jgi:hypothetical protein
MQITFKNIKITHQSGLSLLGINIIQNQKWGDCALKSKVMQKSLYYENIK